MQIQNVNINDEWYSNSLLYDTLIVWYRWYFYASFQVLSSNWVMASSLLNRARILQEIFSKQIAHI